MQTLTYELGPFDNPNRGIRPGLVGVVGSGDLEILIEAAPLDDKVRFHISTSVHGFDDTWEAVTANLASRFRLANLVITVNDAGATPAVVSLRLMQAVEEFGGRA
ncbi:MAG: mdcC1 [Herbaspirillum sp.]|jgi:malonate decarboxylase delta subunit|nr:mdcC1 [Herbaspirillum sp.]